MNYIHPAYEDLHRSFPTLLLLLLLLLLSACRGPVEKAAGADTAANLLPAATALVESRDDPRYIELSGSVIAESSVPLTTKLMSEITMLRLEVGQHVRAGEVLVRLDDSDIQAMRSEAAAYRAEAQAVLSEVDAVKSQADAGVSQAQAGVAQAEARLLDAQRDLERMQALFDSQVISRSELDKVQLGVTVATEGLNQAQAAQQQAEAAVEQALSRTPQVEAKERQASARDMQAAALQNYAVLTAPFDGIVKARYFEQGQLSVPGQPIVVIERSSGMRVLVSMPDNIAMRVRLGDVLQLAIDNGPQRELREGVVSVLGASADPASRSVPVELEISDGQGLFSGQFVRVLVPSGEQGVLSIPQSALLTEGELEYVWRVSSGGLLTRCAVDSGQRMAGRVEILRGLSEGDRVVSEPQAGMFAGARIALPAAEDH